MRENEKILGTNYLQARIGKREAENTAGGIAVYKYRFHYFHSQVCSAININTKEDIFIYYGRDTNPQALPSFHTPIQKRIQIHSQKNNSKFFHTPIKKTSKNTKQKTNNTNNNREDNHGREKEDNNCGREDSRME